MKKKVYILGIILGLIVPYIGIFMGLQVSTTLGNIFAFPIIAIAYLLDAPFGMWHPAMWLVAIASSIVIWTMIVWIIDKALSKDKGNQNDI